MLVTLFGYRQEYLVTIGDIVASFLDDPDPTTKGMCLVTAHDFLAWNKHWTLLNDPWAAEPIEYNPNNHKIRWASSSSEVHLALVLIMYGLEKDTDVNC